MARRVREVIIPKEKVTFWLDRNGFWHNENEKFQNQRIINYFHSCIRKDSRGFHLAQRHREHLEKAYFSYEDTALFVFDVIKGEPIILVLNTQKRIRLRPKKLFTRKENLYMQLGEDEIKFTEHSLVKIADKLQFDGEDAFIRFKDKKYRIEER
jgi:hypothetical protein